MPLFLGEIAYKESGSHYRIGEFKLVELSEKVVQFVSGLSLFSIELIQLPQVVRVQRLHHASELVNVFDASEFVISNVERRCA